MLPRKIVSLLVLTCLLATPLMANTEYDYATKLASLLADVQDKSTTFSADTWKHVANEALNMAAKLYLGRTPKTDAAVKDARKHVREMYNAAFKGDADGARAHAAMAQPYVYKIIELTGPKK